MEGCCTSWKVVALSDCCCTQWKVVALSGWLLHPVDGCCTQLMVFAHSGWLLQSVEGCCTQLMVVAHSGWLLHSVEGCCTQLMVVALTPLIFTGLPAASYTPAALSKHYTPPICTLNTKNCTLYNVNWILYTIYTGELLAKRKVFRKAKLNDICLYIFFLSMCINLHLG